MAVYDFVCHDCKILNEIKLTFSEHSEKKNSIFCEKCGKQMTQRVVPLRFTLKGEGWFGSNANANDNPYTITQRELNKNLEKEKEIEDVANNYGCKNQEEEQ